MFCKLCQRFNTCNEHNLSTIFYLLPCVLLRKDVLARHADSLMDRSAVFQEQERLASYHNHGIVQALSLKSSTILLTSKGLGI